MKYEIHNYRDDPIKMPPVKAIKTKCVECCCGDTVLIRECGAYTCPLYPFRLGKNPFATPRRMTDEQRQASVERLRKARESRKTK